MKTLEEILQPYLITGNEVNNTATEKEVDSYELYKYFEKQIEAYWKTLPIWIRDPDLLTDKKF